MTLCIKSNMRKVCYMHSRYARRLDMIQFKKLNVNDRCDLIKINHISCCYNN